MTDLPVLHQREEPVAKAGGVVPTHREVCPNQFAPGRGDGNAGRQCFDRCNHSPARPVHGTAAGRSATLGECRKEASSWLNAAYRSYGLDASVEGYTVEAKWTGRNDAAWRSSPYNPRSQFYDETEIIGQAQRLLELNRALSGRGV